MINQLFKYLHDFCTSMYICDTCTSMYISRFVQTFVNIITCIILVIEFKTISCITISVQIISTDHRIQIRTSNFLGKGGQFSSSTSPALDAELFRVYIRR